MRAPRSRLRIASFTGCCGRGGRSTARDYADIFWFIRVLKKKRIKVIGNVSGDVVQIGLQNNYKKPTTGKTREREPSSEEEMVGDNVIEVIDEDVVDEAQVLPLAALNKHYLLAAEIFTESRLADGKIPYIPPTVLDNCEVGGCQEKNCVEAEFYSYYIGNALRNLSVLPIPSCYHGDLANACQPV